MDVFDVFASFNLLDFMSNPLSKIRHGMDQTGAAGSSLSGKMGALTKSMLPFVAAAGLFLASLAPAIGVAANFEQSISEVGAVSGATASQMQTLEQAAQDLGASTAWSASQVASAEKSLAMAGFEVKDNVAALPGVLNLASAAQHDLGSTADIASNILSSFSMKANEMGKVADILTTTFTSSNTTLASLSSTLANAGPVAAAAGASLSDVAAMAGKLGDVGIDASVAGTGIKIMFQRLQAPAGGAAKALKHLGITTKDAQGNMLPIFDILGNLETALSGMGSADKAAYLQKIFGSEAVGPIQALMTTGISTIKEYAASLEKPGKAAEVAAMQLDNFNGATTILGSAFEALQITIGNIFLPVLTYLVKGVTSVVTWLNKLASSPVGRFFIAFAAALAVVVVSIGIFSAVMWAATLAAGALNIALLANPIVLIGAAIVAAAVLIISYWTEIKDFFVGLISYFTPVIDFLSNAFEPVKAAFADVGSDLEDLGSTISEALEPLSDLFDGICEAWDNLAQDFFGGNDDAESSFKVWETISSIIGTGVRNSFILLGAAIRIILNPIKMAISGIKTFVELLSGKISLREAGVRLVSTFVDGIKTMVMVPYNAVKKMLSNVRKLLPFSDAKEGPLSTLTLSGKRTMETLATGVHSGAGSFFDAVSSALSAPGKLLDAGIGALSVPVDMVSRGLDAAGEMLFGPSPEPAEGGAPTAEVSPVNFKPAANTSRSKHSSSKSSGITIQNMTVNMPDVTDAEGFKRELQKLLEKYDG
ncbi:phage tail tape measure protein [Maridesulfovibrio bastinii]|uniref:phage tail tape measure protein n=1 Tax=Maridesulfovibrio bastinii TaxID=47157 RepID=UPI0004139431|nr:phage tail tape measure protein [Maridesulfovibrio bastinii]